MCEGTKSVQDDIRVWAAEETSNPIPAKSSPLLPKPRRRTLLKKQQSAPNLLTPAHSVWGVVQAVQKIQQEDESSVYSGKVEKYEVPEFKIAIPLTPHTETKKKLVVPKSTGQVSERLPRMNQVPAIFDICVTPKSTVGGYTKSLSKAEQQRIHEIMHPPMDDDAISAISSSTRKSRSKRRSSSKKSDRSVSSKRSSGKLKKAASLPDLLGGSEETYFKRSTSDRTLCSNILGDKDSTKKSSRKSSKRRSSSKKLKKLDSERAITSKRRSSKSPSKMKKSSSCPSLSDGAEKKKKRSSKKLNKSNSDRSLSTDLAVGGKKKRERRPRSNSTSMLDPTFYAEAEALKAEVEDRLRMVKLKLDGEEKQDESSALPPSPPIMMETPPPPTNQRKTGAHEEERIRVFAESTRRSASLSPSRFKLGDVDGYRKVTTNDRRFRKSWSKVLATPPTTPKQAVPVRPSLLPPPPVSVL